MNTNDTIFDELSRFFISFFVNVLINIFHAVYFYLFIRLYT